MSKLTKEEKDKIMRGMRDKTMDRLEEMKLPEKENIQNFAEQLYLLYHAMTEVGFTKSQAMELVKHVISMGAKII